jgi:transposase
VYQLRAKENNERMILIVDNARIHHTKKLKEYCNKRKIILVYLPPYSPNLNPIEILRKMLKREYRKIQWKYENIKD